jgi:hypothetical protein
MGNGCKGEISACKKSQHLDLLQGVLNSLLLGIDTQLLGANKAIDSILTYF